MQHTAVKSQKTPAEASERKPRRQQLWSEEEKALYKSLTKRHGYCLNKFYSHFT
jgi:hypothetical protein